MSKLRVSSFAVSIDFGAGEALWAGVDLSALGYEPVKHIAGERAMHVFLRRRV